MNKLLKILILNTVFTSLLIIGFVIFSNGSSYKKIIEPNEVIAGTLIPVPDCLENYDTWPSSENFREGLWSIGMIRPAEKEQFRPIYNNYIDINGDGLLDYVYYDNTTDKLKKEVRQCVYINNGKGWTPAWRCYADWSNSSGMTYYGDCALTTTQQPINNPPLDYKDGTYAIDFMRRNDVEDKASYQNFMDINGDGLADFVKAYSYYDIYNNVKNTKNQAYLNNGQGWTRVYNCTTTVDPRTGIGSYSSTCALGQ